MLQLGSDYDLTYLLPKKNFITKNKIYLCLWWWRNPGWVGLWEIILVWYTFEFLLFQQRKSKFESDSKLSSCSVFDIMLLMFKCPPSNPFGFICLSHNILAWLTSWRKINFLFPVVVLKCSVFTVTQVKGGILQRCVGSYIPVFTSLV